MYTQEACRNPHTGFLHVFSACRKHTHRTPNIQHTHTHTKHTPRRHQQHHDHDHNDTHIHTTPHGDRETERETESDRERQRKKTEKEDRERERREDGRGETVQKKNQKKTRQDERERRQDKTKEDETIQEGKRRETGETRQDKTRQDKTRQDKTRSRIHVTSFRIMKCNVDIRVNSYITVLLPGGTTMFQEIGERLTVKPTELPPSMTKIKVVAPPERQYSVLIGGSPPVFFFFADVDLEGEYDGSGPTIVLTSRMSCQRCSMEFDSVSEFYRVPTW